MSLTDTIAQIREYHKMRQDYMTSEGDIVRRCKAVCRRLYSHTEVNRKEKGESLFDIAWDVYAGKAIAEDTEGTITCGKRKRPCSFPKELIEKALGNCLGFFKAWEPQHEQKMQAEKAMVKLVRTMPAYVWAEKVYGFGDVGYAQIVGEAGDLSLYSNPAKVWKRMGLGVMPDGTRQRLIANNPEAAIIAGYDPRRRAIMHIIGDSLIRMTKKANPYREFYLAQKRKERVKLGLPAEKDEDAEPETPGKPVIAHKRALRNMEKRLLKDLWRVTHHPEKARTLLDRPIALILVPDEEDLASVS